LHFKSFFVKKEKINFFDFLLKLTFKGKKPTNQQIKKAILEVSDIFTFLETERQFNYMREERLLKGYLLYFVPVNLSKIYSIFKELLRHSVFFSKTKLKILDIGCGPSSALVPLFEFINDGITNLEHIRYVGIESEDKAIEAGEKIIKELKPEKLSLKYEFIKADASDFKLYLKLKDIKPDIVIFSNSLGELFGKKSFKIEDFINLIKLLTYNNSYLTLILIEPATKKASMRLHRIRDRLIEELGLYPYSPCLNNLPCPALKANNWCYEQRKWLPPDYLSFLSSIGLQVNYLKFSYIVLRKDRANIKDTFRLSALPLGNTSQLEASEEIIKNTSHLLNEKGKSRLWACWKGELIDMEKLKRDFKEEDLWLKIRKGDYFSIDKYITLSERKVRIPKNCNIKILYSPGL